MHNEKKEFIIAITGASGTIYAFRLLQILTEMPNKAIINLLISNAALSIIDNELESSLKKKLNEIIKHKSIIQYSNDDFTAPFASGNSSPNAMIVVPCSMKTLAGIASGFSNNLILRAADVMLKERKKLILVPRETPLNLIHLQNMVKATKAGAIILPAMPAFYFKPISIQNLVDFIIAKILSQLEINHSIIKKWAK